MERRRLLDKVAVIILKRQGRGPFYPSPSTIIQNGFPEPSLLSRCQDHGQFLRLRSLSINLLSDWKKAGTHPFSRGASVESR